MISTMGVKNNQQLFVEVVIKSTQLISRMREMIYNGKSKQQIIDEKWPNQTYISAWEWNSLNTWGRFYNWKPSKLSLCILFLIGS